MANNPKKSADVTIVSTNSFLVDGSGGFNIVGLGSDGKMYQWNYLQGSWLENWATKEEIEFDVMARKELARQERAAAKSSAKFGPKGKDGKVTYQKKKAGK